MHISGFLPAPALPAQRQDRSPADQSAPKNSSDNSHKSRRTPTEYIFDGEVLDDAKPQDSARTAYTQRIDPANQGAISSYAEHQQPHVRQGRLLDIFI